MLKILELENRLFSSMDGLLIIRCLNINLQTNVIIIALDPILVELNSGKIITVDKVVLPTK
jgi:hypothetical protein